jgi:DNA-binding response OmpR family regulator
MALRILIVEDESKISRVLALELTHEGYETDTAETGRDGLEKALTGRYDLILLDIMLPELNGLEVLRRLKSADVQTPVIFLTARGATPDIVSGLDMGADDYVAKPFEIEELLARIRSVIRKHEGAARQAEKPVQLAIDRLTVNARTREVVREGRKIDLTPKEYDLLVYLLEHKNEVLSREQIIQNVWGYDFVGDTNTVDVYIRYLRRKIDYKFKKQLIQTVRGVGYCIRETGDEDPV